MDLMVAMVAVIHLYLSSFGTSSLGLGRSSGLERLNVASR